MSYYEEYRFLILSKKAFLFIGILKQFLFLCKKNDS